MHVWWRLSKPWWLSCSQSSFSSALVSTSLSLSSLIVNRTSALQTRRALPSLIPAHTIKSNHYLNYTTNYIQGILTETVQVTYQCISQIWNGAGHHQCVGDWTISPQQRIVSGNFGSHKLQSLKCHCSDTLTSVVSLPRVSHTASAGTALTPWTDTESRCTSSVISTTSLLSLNQVVFVACCCLNLLSFHCLCLGSALQCQNQWLACQLQCQTFPSLPTSRTTSPCSKEKLVTNCLFQRIKTCSRRVSTNRKVNKNRSYKCTCNNLRNRNRNYKRRDLPFYFRSAQI